MIRWTCLVWLSVVLYLYSSITLVTSRARCLWHKDQCVDICPEWMVEKETDCSKTYGSAQKTCENPEEMLVGTVCGFARCDCPDGMVLDTDTGFCYDVDNCPTKHTDDK